MTPFGSGDSENTKYCKYCNGSGFEEHITCCGRCKNKECDEPEGCYDVCSGCNGSGFEPDYKKN